MKGKRYISDFSVIIVFSVLGLLGLILTVDIPVRTTPQSAAPSLTVSYNWTGAGARGIENAVTAVLEPNLARLPGVKHISSLSTEGAGSIDIDFHYGTDMEKARLAVATALRQLSPQLPREASYPTIQMYRAGRESPAVVLGISAPDNDRKTDFHIKSIQSALEARKDVRKVSVGNSSRDVCRIYYDAAQLAALGLSREAVAAAVKAHFSTVQVGAYTFGNAVGKDFLENLYLSLPGGGTVPASQLLRTSPHERDEVYIYRINGEPTRTLNIYATEDANRLLLGRRVQETVAALDLPDNISARVHFDESEVIRGQLESIAVRTAVTVLILLGLILLLSRSLRYTLLVGLSLLISTAICMLAYRAFDVEIQRLTLAAITISLNLVINNLVVMIEHSSRRSGLGSFTAILAGSLTTVALLSLLFMLPESYSMQLGQFAVVVGINLGVSLFTACLFVPALNRALPTFHFPGAGSRKVESKESVESVESVWKVYGRLVSGLVRWRWVVLGVFVLFCAASIYLFSTRVKEGVYFDDADGLPEVQVSLTMPYGTSVSHTDRQLRSMEAYISSLNVVKGYETSASNRQGTIRVLLKPENATALAAVTSQIFSFAGTLDGVWVVSAKTGSYNSGAVTATENLAVQLKGYNYDKLMSMVDVLTDSLSSMKRVESVMISNTPINEQPVQAHQWRPDASTLSYYGVDVADYQYALAGSYGGKLRWSVPRQGVFELVPEKEERRDLWAFENISPVAERHLGTAIAGTRRSYSTTPGISRYDREYVIFVKAAYLGTAEAARAQLTPVLESINASSPAGFDARLYNVAGEEEDTSANYLLIALTGIGLVFLISAVYFNSLLMPLLIICSIPVGCSGAMLTFYLFNYRIDDGAFAAILLVGTVTVNCVINVLGQYRDLLTAYPRASRTRLYIQAIKSKSRSTAVGLLCTAFSFAPFILISPRLPFWFNMAVGTMGGIAVSALTIVFLLPLISSFGSRRG